MKLGESMNRLTRKDSRLLEDYVRENYTSSNLSDTAFAVVATSTLGFTVTRGNVDSARKVFDIPATGVAIRAAAKARQSISASERDALLQQMADLDRRIAVVENRLEVYITGSRARVAAA